MRTADANLIPPRFVSRILCFVFEARFHFSNEVIELSCA